MIKRSNSTSVLSLLTSLFFGQRRRAVSSLATQVSSPLQCPAPDDRDAWHAYWKSQGQLWRTEPEISRERQEYLAEQRRISPDIEQGIYPFKGVKLNRADIEWLLSTHENGRGPVDWSDESQRERMGLDVRGAELHQVDLSNLPLARLQAGLPPIKIEWSDLTEGQRAKATMLLAEADFIGAHLEEVNLTKAHLEGAYLCDAHLEGAYLCVAHLEEAHLAWAHLKLADFTWAHLEGANMTGAHLEEASLNNAILGDKQGIGPRLLDVHWDNTHLAVVDWSQIKKLHEEHQAHQKKTSTGEVKDKSIRLSEHENAVRATRQLAIALLSQGLNEDASRFTYHAQVLQKRVWWFQMIQRSAKLRQRVQAFAAWLFSWFLFLLAGYGYRLWRSFLVYIVVIVGFAIAYYFLGGLDRSSLSLVNAFALSMTSFHGRGFFPGVTQLNDTLTILASVEAFVGLILEATFIATLAQRFFGK